MTTARILLDGHVGRVFERLLRERGHEVEQAKDRFGEYATDDALLQRCADNGVVLVTNNASDFEPLHREHDHAGILLYYEQALPDTDPEDWPELSTRSSTSTERTASRTNWSISASGTSGFTGSVHSGRQAPISDPQIRPSHA
ncbi:DUF5615 family PIN-like protein [Halorubrum sp. AD140]|uniref:DUF5615 family PIN-like protein n=1 Tax=Halorubrum sp. AD140 TaxID=3050073 RepID=UPI002ACC55C5|nr:DUF5615 family PIN-like protein [Halorubrum sp. AD140]MDZ5813024.1 DUF5615 family PIN-like protein [Halorubrum sp. AD140]